MLHYKQIKELFTALNKELAHQSIQGEVLLCGGAVMCLVFKTRVATQDIDGIFHPTKEIRKAVKKISKRFQIPSDWLNDAAKGFFYSDPPKQRVLQLSHLKIYAPQADYLLAMKAVSARFDSYDYDDLVFLVKHLELKNSQEAFKIIEKYYPKKIIPTKTYFLIEELIGK